MPFKSLFPPDPFCGAGICKSQKMQETYTSNAVQCPLPSMSQQVKLPVHRAEQSLAFEEQHPADQEKAQYHTDQPAAWKETLPGKPHLKHEFCNFCMIIIMLLTGPQQNKGDLAL